MDMNSITRYRIKKKGEISTTPFSEEVLSHCFHFSSSSEKLRTIFRDNFFKIEHLVEPYVADTVHKMINCQNMEIGYTTYQCPHCLKYKTVPFTCHTRFCPTCGNMINMQRSNAMAEKMFDTIHRHGVFTLPDSLREIVYVHKKLLHAMTQAATETIEKVVHDVCPSLDPKPGIIWVIHTFSRSSEWNPHVHCIFTMGGITKYGKWFQLSGNYISYEKMRLVYQDILLKKFRKVLGPTFIEIDKKLRAQFINGFYVRAKKAPESIESNSKRLVKYLTRYLGRPCISSERIDGYNGQYVFLHYIPHDEHDDSPPSTTTVYEKILVTEFMLRLTDHVPEPNFQMVGYAGIYANVNAKNDRVLKALKKKEVSYLYSPEKHDYRVSHTKWQKAMKRVFHVDPLECPDCKEQMVALFCKYKGIFYDAEPQNGRRRKIVPPPNAP